MHSAICDTYLGVMVLSEIYCQLKWALNISSVYVHSAICVDLFGVTLFHRCVVNLSLGG